MVDEEVAGDDIYHEDLQCHPDLNYPGFLSMKPSNPISLERLIKLFRYLNDQDV